ncbi:MAG: DNA adenine methylase [Finegoldia sp.]|uniref:DNA adenine methylase n=1 Tax=Finegoldia sp. TaxID=1981334 RepID=UPI0039938678
MKPIIKWPGGKSREFNKIKSFIPKYTRYIEPFFGGGAVFFELMPSNAIINDISSSLMSFYELVKEQNEEFKETLLKYDSSFQSLIYTCDLYSNEILESYYNDDDTKSIDTIKFILSKSETSENIILDLDDYSEAIITSVLDKFDRTKQNTLKRKFSDIDLLENLITGFTSGFYLYFRNIFNDINLNKIDTTKPFEIANFYFIREYCYGSMFRYNKKGEFNIPYGGMSYNRKQFINKIDSLFNVKTKNIFKNTKIYNLDFEKFLDRINLTTDDFIFLDPPYDTDFSDYEGNSFELEDQIRLCNYLKNIPSKFILIIKNTDFIYDLYKSDFEILSFKKKYSYNVRSRNERSVTHLIIKNF